jgi:GNAT superfamily N-acetyltransferase
LRGPRLAPDRADRLDAISLDASQAGEIVSVLSEAFHEYPVMRFVLGGGPGYDRRLAILVGLVVASRIHRAEPMLGIRDDGGILVGAAVVSISSRVAPPDLGAVREQTWHQLGDDALRRYEIYGNACQPLTPTVHHHHLNMIGVRRSHAGTGLGRRLLEAVHQVARQDPDSAGVSLSTEVPQNVELYRHFGYQLLGQASVAEGVETWGMFRPVE